MARTQGTRRAPRTAADADRRLRAIDEEIARILQYFPDLRRVTRRPAAAPARHADAVRSVPRSMRMLH